MLGTILDVVPRFITKKWVQVHDQSGNAEDRYKPSKQIRFKTLMLRPDLFDAYIVVKGDIILTKANQRGFSDLRNRFLAFKNNALFTNCISKINNVLIENAEDLYVVKPMYNLLEYSKSYIKTTGSLWNFYRDGLDNSPLNDDDPPTVNYNGDPLRNSEYFKCKSSITGKTSNENRENGRNTEQGNAKTKTNLEIVVPLKYLRNFGRSLDMPLINCEVSLTLSWSESCVLTHIKKH